MRKEDSSWTGKWRAVASVECQHQVAGALQPSSSLERSPCSPIPSWCITMAYLILLPAQPRELFFLALADKLERGTPVLPLKCWESKHKFKCRIFSILQALEVWLGFFFPCICSLLCGVLKPALVPACHTDKNWPQPAQSATHVQLEPCNNTFPIFCGQKWGHVRSF